MEEKKQDIWMVKASYMSEGQEIYFKRALLNIKENNDLLAMSKTKEGAESLFTCISNALQMGLQIGGQIPQAYIVAMPTKNGKKAVLVPTINGYKFIVLSDPPVLKDFFISPVYEKELDGFSINKPGGIVNHMIYAGKDRGQLIGVYAIMENLSGVKRADWMTRTEIENLRNNYSPSYKAYKAGKLPAEYCSWLTDFDMQAIKTAGKRFLKPYAGLKEGLAMALSVSDEIEEIMPIQPDNRDIEDRVNSKLDNIIDAESEPIEEEKPQKEEPKKQSTEEKSGGNDLPF
jgi:recombinational DNA repair protein RecT